MHYVRPIRIEGPIAFVPLTQGYEAIIDAADVPRVADRNWCAAVVNGHVYARNGVTDMRAAILGNTDGKRVFQTCDLDYRRAALRVAGSGKKGIKQSGTPSKRQIRVEGEIAHIPLSRGYEAIIDAEDVPLVEPFTWSAQVSNGRPYAVTNLNGRFVYLRQMLVKPPAGTYVKSKGDSLDCRKASLEIMRVRERRQRQVTPIAKPLGRPRSKAKVQLQPRNPNFELGQHPRLFAA